MSTNTKAGPSRSDRPILEVLQICKSFPGVRVLKSVNLSIWPAEVHAFMGENGAGKSTLMKILAGAYQADSGEIILDGKPVQLRTPHEARLAGIGIIYQELTVAPNLTVSGNVFLGSELKRLGFMTDTAEMDRKTQEVLNRLGARFKATQRAAHLSVAEQQQVEIARALFYKSRVLAPLFVQSVFGILGGIGTHHEDVMHMKRTADRLFGEDYRWSVLGAGRKQFPIVALAAAMGGNIRVGLEDSLWIGAGELATSNAAQVHRGRQIIECLGFEVATPADAREILSLKGGDKVAF